ncbi:MAG: hypothetical protein JO079_07540 [Frankiaceae bacterium]|nr:hypothetical protein [Frankiaceae bacterium]
MGVTAVPRRRLARAVLAVAIVAVGAIGATDAFAARRPAVRPRTGVMLHTVTTTTRLPVSQLRLMNYYPAANGWTLMWSSYSHASIAADMQAIASLGANAVRVIVQPSAVGYPTVVPAMLANFRDFLTTAHTAGLSVQLTLFDWWSSYADVAGSEAWLRSLLADQSGNPAIALVELQNELPISNGAAVGWANTLLPYLSQVLPGVPRTLTVPSSLGVAGITTLLSDVAASSIGVVDVHYYADASGAADVIRQTKTAAGDRPVIIGESGLSTPDGAAGEEAQARFYRVLGRTTAALGVPPAAPWTLNDFAPTAIPNYPTATEYHFGLRRLDGTWKPAADAVRESFAGSVDNDIDGGFEREVNNGGARLGAWTPYDTTDGAGQVASDLVRSGLQAVCFSATSGHATAVPSVMQKLPVLIAGDRFTVTTYVDRLLPTGAERIALAWFGSAGQYLGQVESANATTSNAWEQLAVTATAPAGAVTAQVHLKAAYETGRACYDDTTISY